MLIRANDREINLVCENDPFVAYLPHTCYELPNLIVTHRNCRAFNYIEEGLTAYYEPGEIECRQPSKAISSKGRLIRSMAFRGRLPVRNSFYREDYLMAYGMTTDSYPNWPRRKEVGLPELFSRIPDCEESEGETRHVLVFDAVVEARRTSSGALVMALINCLEIMICKGVSQILYKFHPIQTDRDTRVLIKAVFARFSAQIRALELEPNFHLEEFFSSRNCKVYVFNSAAGLYAALAGRDVLTLNSLVQKYDPDYLTEIETLPKIFNRLIQPIS